MVPFPLFNYCMLMIPLFGVAMVDVPIAATTATQKFPVVSNTHVYHLAWSCGTVMISCDIQVVFSHGLGGHADIYTIVAEELARYIPLHCHIMLMYYP
jgi:hypothetical protein